MEEIKFKFKPEDRVWALKQSFGVGAGEANPWEMVRNIQVISFVRIKIFLTLSYIVYVMNSGAEFEESDVFLGFIEAYREVDKRNEKRGGLV